MEKEKGEGLPIIIPLVIYHGEEQWNVKTRLEDSILGYEELPWEVKEYITDYGYLYVFGQYEDEEIEEISMLNLTMRMLRDIRRANAEELIAVLLKSYVY